MMWDHFVSKEEQKYCISPAESVLGKMCTYAVAEAAEERHPTRDLGGGRGSWAQNEMSGQMMVLVDLFKTL